MNPYLCRVVLRPRDPFEVFDLTLRFLRVHWRPITRLGALLVGLPTVALAPLLWLTSGSAWWLLFPLALVLPVQAPMSALVGLLLFDEDATVRQALRMVWSRAPSLLAGWVALAVGAAIAAGSCGILSPLLLALLFVMETGMLEAVPVVRMVRRSQALAGAHLGVAIAGALAQVLLLLWFAVLFELGGQLVVGWVLQLGVPFGRAQDGQLTPWLVAGILSSQVLFAAYRLFLYVDVRTRVEGWDLQVALRAAAMTKERA